MFVATLRQALTSAFHGVVVLIVCAKTLVDTGAAFAAYFIPEGSARALADRVNVAKGVGSRVHRNACADAHASFVVPLEVGFTILDVASAFALFIIPVVRVVEALLSSALECAVVRVESHNDSIESVRCLELAQTLASLHIEVVSFIALSAVNESASNHVPNLAFGSGSAWGVAAANSR